MSFRSEKLITFLLEAWEMLLYARIINKNSNKIYALYRYNKDGGILRNRNNDPILIDFHESMKTNKIDKNIRHNLEVITRIKDNYINLYTSENLDNLIYVLASASIRNYTKICNKWFETNLNTLYIFPPKNLISEVSFSESELSSESELFIKLLKTIVYYQQNEEESEYNFAINFTPEFKKAKKLIVQKQQKIKTLTKTKTNLFNQPEENEYQKDYPYSFSDLSEKILNKIPSTKVNHIFRLQKKHDIKNKKEYAIYIFKSAEKEKEYIKTGKLPPGTSSLYSEASFDFFINELKKKYKI